MAWEPDNDGVIAMKHVQLENDYVSSSNDRLDQYQPNQLRT